MFNKINLKKKTSRELMEFRQAIDNEQKIRSLDADAMVKARLTLSCEGETLVYTVGTVRRGDLNIIKDLFEKPSVKVSFRETTDE